MNEILDNQEGYETPQNTPEVPPQYKTPEMHPLNVLVICIGFFLLGNLICGGLILVLAKMQGLDFTDLLGNLNENSPIMAVQVIPTTTLTLTLSLAVPTIKHTIVLVVLVVFQVMIIVTMDYLVHVGALVLSVPLDDQAMIR